MRKPRTIWRMENTEKMRLSRLKSSIRRQGISYERYLEMVEEQEGKCAICGSAPSPDASYNRNRLVIDHDHSCCSGKLSCGKCIRNLVCGNCNIGMGQFKDSPEALRAAAAYLERHASSTTSSTQERTWQS